jgi:hypothetical protein
MSEWNTPAGERVKGALLGFVGGAVWLGLLVWSISEERKPPPAVPPDVPKLEARLDALERRASEAEVALSGRCLTISTGKLDVAIFPVENLGKKEIKR